MLSICIPIYNYNVNKLVAELYNQCNELNVSVEIICIDDASSIEYKRINAETCKQHSRYIELDKNIGRARIRNLFLHYAKYDFLLFLDCDVKIISPKFVFNYIQSLQGKTSLILCGGRIYDKNKPTKDKLLRWVYGYEKESLPIHKRNLKPNASFMTNNFIIQKEVFGKFKFNENLTQYGHEDTLYGYILKKNQITITHINNPVLNEDIETNSEFIRKTEQGLQNLLVIIKDLNYDPAFIQDVTILKVFITLKRFYLVPMFALNFRLFRKVMKYLLEKRKPNLFLFDLYKLGYLSYIYSI